MCSPIMDDGCWHEVPVRELCPHATVTLLGRELTVGFACPSPRGGDFYVLEAYGDGLEDIISFTLDKNTRIWARN